MKKSQVLALTLLTLACGPALAVSVSQSDAALAVRAWASGGARMGVRVGGTIAGIAEYATTNGVPFYAFRMAGGGTVFTSADTECEPIVAFTSESVTALDEKSPLYALINRDLAVRGASKAAPSFRRLGAASANASTGATTSAAAARWASLVARGEELDAKPSSTLKAAGKDPISSDEDISDLRVAPLLKSKWGQGTAYNSEFEEVPCYNYYTPECKVTVKTGDDATISTQRCVCGCVATAMAQTMRYWSFPQGDMPSFSNPCTRPGNTTIVMNESGDEVESYVNPIKNVTLETVAGAYDWKNMTLVPYTSDSKSEEEPEDEGGEITSGRLRTPEIVGEPVEEINAKAIGKLTYDCGVAVKMNYNISDMGGSGVPLTLDGCGLIAGAFTGYFGYSSALYSGDNLTGSEAKRRKAILANLDANCPVILLITGDGGHAVVGDGYGYDEEGAPFVHLNMGWSGQCDVWYNLPAVNTSDNPENFSGFDTVNAVICNIFTNETGVILSGRIHNGDEPVSNAVVTLTADGVAVAETTSSEYGIYSFIISKNGTYGVTAMTVDENFTTNSCSISGIAMKTSTTPIPGNSWGNDIELTNPVALVDGICYPTINAAIDAARNSGSTVELIDSSVLTASETIDFACSITSAVPNNVIVCKEGAEFSVAGNGNLHLNNVILVEDQEKAVTVVFTNVTDIVGFTNRYVTVTNDLDRADTEMVFSTEAKTATVSGGLAVVRQVVTALDEITEEELVDQLTPFGMSLNVADGGCLYVSGKTVVGVLESLDELKESEKMTVIGMVTTASSTGFAIEEEFTGKIVLSCAQATQIGDKFGMLHYVEQTEEIRNGAANVIAKFDEHIIGSVGKSSLSVSSCELVWSEAPVDPSEAIGCVVSDGGAITNYSRCLDYILLQAKANNGSEIVLNGNQQGTLGITKGIVFTNDIVIAAEKDVLVSGFTPVSRITAGEGANVTLRNITFDGSAGGYDEKIHLLVVDGGEMTLDNVTINGFVGNAGGLGQLNSGAVNVMSGTLNLKGGTTISNCSVKPLFNDLVEGFGGGVYVNGTGCSLNLDGCRFTNNSATTYGGAVYVKDGSQFSVSGNTSISGNAHGNTEQTRVEDNVYIVNHAKNLGNVELVGQVVGRVGIRWGESSVDGNVAGDAFLTVASGVDAASSLAMFTSDVSDDLVATSAGGKLVWKSVAGGAKIPLTVIADDQAKQKGAADPEFTYTVYCPQDTVPDGTIVGAFGREEGENVGTYAITNISIGCANDAYSLKSVQDGSLTITANEILPELEIPQELPAEQKNEIVKETLQAANLTDSKVAQKINNSEDPVAAYDSFREWSNNVEGGQAAVQASDKALVSYNFGVTELFEEEPTVTFENMAIDDPATASMSVTLTVKDGESEKSVNAESVAKLFEVSTDLNSWSDEVTATPTSEGTSGTVSFTVTPTDTTLTAAFIRLKY